jgi:septal ring factor EnvC (AmiA/AmiB activator)
MDEKQVKQLKVNTKNIAALHETLKALGEQITGLQDTVQTQARSITTLSNDLVATKEAMAQAAAVMGHGPTVRQ